ncbi:glycosyltransferase family 2 protein [Candidatus Bathyarchaeota archaeon]|nr:glycosyltransferase family 2 protein [Candidatus Bathyarchaeota archaeon]
MKVTSDQIENFGSVAMARARYAIVACIPAYNEEMTIAKTILQVQKFVDRVIVADDGSTDMTASIAEGLGATVIRNGHGGKGSALRSAFALAQKLDAEIIVTLDADGQHDPTEIPVLVKPIKEKKAEVTVGSRFMQASKTDFPPYRRFGLKVINSLSRKSCNNIVKDTQCGFRAYSTKALDVIQQCESDGFGVEAEQLSLISKCGMKVQEVPVTVSYKGLYKTSKRHPLAHGSEIILSALRLLVEQRPLSMLGLPGSLLVFTGLITGAYVLWDFNLSRAFTLPVALVSIGSLCMGTLLSVSSIMLFAIAKLREDAKRQFRMATGEKRYSNDAS